MFVILLSASDDHVLLRVSSRVGPVHLLAGLVSATVVWPLPSVHVYRIELFRDDDDEDGVDADVFQFVILICRSETWHGFEIVWWTRPVWRRLETGREMKSRNWFIMAFLRSLIVWLIHTIITTCLVITLWSSGKGVSSSVYDIDRDPCDVVHRYLDYHLRRPPLDSRSLSPRFWWWWLIALVSFSSKSRSPNAI